MRVDQLSLTSLPPDFMIDPKFSFYEGMQNRNAFKRWFLDLRAKLGPVTGGVPFIREVAVGAPVSTKTGVRILPSPSYLHRTNTMFLPAKFIEDVRGEQKTKALLILAHELTHAVDFEALRAAGVALDSDLLEPTADAAQTLWLEYRAEVQTLVMLSKGGAIEVTESPGNYVNTVDAPLTKMVRVMGRADSWGGSWEESLHRAMSCEKFPIDELHTLHECLLRVRDDVHGYLQIAEVLKSPALWALTDDI